MNSVIFIGRLVRDPELKYIPNTGTAVATFTIAVDRDFKSEGQPDADFINIVVWKKLAESCSNYLCKGQMCGVKGRLQNRKYTTKSGDERTMTEIIADSVQFLDKPKGSQEKKNSADPYDARYENSLQKEQEDITPVDDGDIPF